MRTIQIKAAEVVTRDQMAMAISLVTTVMKALEQGSTVGTDAACAYAMTLDHALGLFEPVQDALNSDFEAST